MFFKEKDIYYKLWSGLVFGNIILMAGIIPFKPHTFTYCGDYTDNCIGN